MFRSSVMRSNASQQQCQSVQANNTSVYKYRYSEQVDISAMIAQMDSYLVDHNGVSKRPMNLAMFLFALEHVARICRILRQPGAHALLVGVGGSGRQSLARLAAFVNGMNFFQVQNQHTCLHSSV